MRTVLACLLAALAGFPACASTAPEGRFDHLARLVSGLKADLDYPTGTAIAVVENGSVVYEGYFGQADLEAGVPVDRQTAFYIASATKPFTALHALLREHHGALDTDTSLQALFPDSAFDQVDAGAITVRELLTHTSGLDNPALVWATAYSGIHDADTRLQLVAQTSPDARAGRGTFRYSNVGYNILGVWLERKAARPWQEQLDASLFRPLGMARTSARISAAESKAWPLAKPYSALSVDRRRALYLRKVDQTMHAAGGMVSTAPDLARFLIAQLGQGRVDGRQVLPADVVARSQVQQAATDGSGHQDFARAGYAWGWYLGDYKGRTMLHHFGGFAGFHAHLSFIPAAGVGLVVLNNEDFLSSQLTTLIADHVYGVLLGEAGIDDTASARFAALAGKARQLDTLVARQHAQIAGRTWNLSLPMQAYAGEYAHALLGTLRVSVDADGTPTLHWGQLEGRATAYEGKDQARVELVPNSGQVVAFEVEGDSVERIRLDGLGFDRVR